MTETAINGAVEAADNCPCDDNQYRRCCVEAAAQHAASEPRPDLGPVFLPWSYFDGTVNVELRATTYPYGAGQPGTEVQITLESWHHGVTVAVRLPDAAAQRLAKAILTGEDNEGGVW